MRKPSLRQSRTDALLPSIRKLLATRPQYTIEPFSGPMRGIDYSRGRLVIAYLAHAECIDGRLRASVPHSLDVRYDAEIVLKIRWDRGSRKTLIYKSGRWESALQFFSRG